jgi:hypothetical protein
MSRNAERRTRTTLFVQAVQWLTLSPEERRGPAFRLWLSQSPEHVEEAIEAALVIFQIRRLSAEDVAKILHAPEPLPVRLRLKIDTPED